MKYRTLGKSKWALSEIGFGCWGIGKKWWGATDDRESITALKTAHDLGINFFDTAYVYGDGHSERLLAEALTEKSVIIATKIPPKNQQWPPSEGTSFQDAFPDDWITSCTDRSLKNLKKDVLDLTQFHVWSDRWLKEGAMESIARLKDSGKIKAFGISVNNHAPETTLELVRSGLVDSVQVIFNIFDQSPMDQLFPLCDKYKVGVIARVPFDEGGLTGTLRHDSQFSEGDFRAQYFRGDHLSQTVERVEKLGDLLDDDTPDIPSLALKFILACPTVTTVIPGMRQEKHVRKNVEVLKQPSLTLDQQRKLKGHAWPRNYYTWWK